jgi:hypothetical protein
MPLSRSWLTRPLFVCPPRIAPVLKASILLALLLMIMTPTLVTVAWHLRHGNAIECRGKAIFVPLRWIAYIGDSNDAVLTKPPLVVWPESRATVTSMISVGRWPPAGGEINELHYKTFENLFWNLHSGFGEAISGPVRMGSGQLEAFCMEGVTPGTSRASVSCTILGGKWTADFMGDKRDVEEFYTIIRRLN